ncbi:unnamed protein product [Fusarium graminearum]|nr:unnamed protein product [Fusarium graminearum]
MAKEFPGRRHRIAISSSGRGCDMKKLKAFPPGRAGVMSRTRTIGTVEEMVLVDGRNVPRTI